MPLMGTWIRTGEVVMLPHRNIGRFLALALTGGCLLQLTGCVTGLLPVALSFAESTIFSDLLNRLAIP